MRQPGRGRAYACIGYHGALLRGRAISGAGAAVERLVSVGGGRHLPAGADAVSGGAATPLVPAQPAPLVAAGGGTGVFCRLSGGGTAAGAGALWKGGRVHRHRLRVAGGGSSRRQGHREAGRLFRRQGCVLRRQRGAGAGAGTALVRHGMVAGRRQHPRHGADPVHGAGRVRPAVPAGGRDRYRRQQGRRPMAAAAGRQGAAGEDRRRVGRPIGAGLSAGGADRRQVGAAGGRRRGHAGDGAGPSVRRIRSALRVSCHAVEPAGAVGQTADAVRCHHPGTALLHGDGGTVAVCGARLHHADLFADRAAVPAEQRRAYLSVGGAGCDPSGEPLCGGQRQLAAELCGGAGHGAAGAPALPGVYRRTWRPTPYSARRALLYRGQSGGNAGRHGIYSAASGVVFQHLRGGSAAGRAVGGTRRRMELYGGIFVHAAGLCVAAAGQSAGLDTLCAGEIYPVAGQGADGPAVPRRSLR